MPTDQTPTQPQALQADATEGQSQAGGEGGPSFGEPSYGAYPEQVFAGESGDPIWETQSARRGPGTGAAVVAEAVLGRREPRVMTDEKIPCGRLIDLVHAPPPPPRARP